MQPAAEQRPRRIATKLFFARQGRNVLAKHIEIARAIQFAGKPPRLFLPSLQVGGKGLKVVKSLCITVLSPVLLFDSPFLIVTRQ